MSPMNVNSSLFKLENDFHIIYLFFKSRYYYVTTVKYIIEFSHSSTYE